MRKKKRLLWQLYPSYLLITLIALVAVTLYATTSLRDFYLNQIASDLRSRAHLLEKQMLQSIGPLDVAVIDANGNITEVNGLVDGVQGDFCGDTGWP